MYTCIHTASCSKASLGFLRCSSCYRSGCWVFPNCSTIVDRGDSTPQSEANAYWSLQRCLVLWIHHCGCHRFLYFVHRQQLVLESTVSAANPIPDYATCGTHHYPRKPKMACFEKQARRGTCYAHTIPCKWRHARQASSG